MSYSLINDNQIYVVVDIEADGPAPGVYSMISFGAVATSATEETSSFYRKILPLEGAKQNPQTMGWWKTQPEAWKEVNTNAEPPGLVMNDFVDWLNELGKEPVFVSQPTGFDYSMISWYLWKFTGLNPFTDETGRIHSIDLPSYVAGKFGISIENTRLKNLPEMLTRGMPQHTHNPLDDARGYAFVFRNAIADTV